MTPDRTFGDRGSYRFDFAVPGVGRIRKKSGARTIRSHNQRVALLTKLRDGDFPRLDLLTAFHRGAVSIVELLDADRRHALPRMVADLYGDRPLWRTVDQVLDGIDRAPLTVQGYRKSWRALQVFGILGADATVGDLARVEWKALEAAWGRSPASWNQLRRAVSRTLTLLLGDKGHQLRRDVLQDFPTREEEGRVPDLTPQQFRVALRHVPAPLRPAIVTLIATGMRGSEYARLRPEHLGRHVVRIPGSKTAGSKAGIAVAPELWPFIVAATPCPVSLWVLRRTWATALKAAKLAHMTLHDLRHCTGQWATDAGMPLPRVMDLLRHKTPAMTLRYAKRKQRQEDAAVLAGVLVPQVATQVFSRAKRKAR